MTKPSKQQKGPQGHPEGAHGDKTHQALLHQLHSRSPEKETDHGQRTSEERPGGHHAFEDREQHDEADKNADKNRLARGTGRSPDGDLRP